MADTNKITYVSLENLGYYDEKLKAYVAAADKVVKDDLQAKIDAANLAIETEATTARAAEATNALAAENAQAAADKAQGEVDALEVYVGTFESETAKTVVEYIDAKTANIASDETVNALANRVKAIEDDYLVEADKTELTNAIEEEAKTARAAEQANAAAIKAVQDDYLKAADKTELANAIAAEKERAEGIESGLEERIETMEAFWEAAQADGTDSDVVDTLKEIQEYIASDETGAAAMAASIKQNSDDIDALEGRMDTAEGEIDDLQTTIATKSDKSALEAEEQARKDGDAALDTRLQKVESAVGEAGSVATDIATAKQEAIEAAAADAAEKDAQVLVDAKAYTDEKDTAMNARVQALEAVDHEHANKELLDTYTQTEADLADAVSKKHAHANAAELDKIADGDVAKWNAAEQNAKDYADGLNTAMDSRMNAVEALAAANKAAHEANAAAIALKADATALTAVSDRVGALETWHTNFAEAETTDIDALFA